MLSSDYARTLTTPHKVQRLPRILCAASIESPRGAYTLRGTGCRDPLDRMRTYLQSV